MNSDPLPNPKADEQASLWAARLEGAFFSAADRAALEAWLAENPAHRALLSSYCQFSADLEVQLPALVEARAVAMPALLPPTRVRWSFPRIAGAAVAAAALVLVCWVARPGAREETFVSPPGQRQTFTLRDGTRVELNAQANLQFAERDGERRAKLSAGEALFMVTKDKARPFIVETPTGSVRVTGTTFDVRTEGATLDVTVVEGAVQVSPSNGSIVGEAPSRNLGAGDRLLANANGVSVRQLSSDALDDVLAWRQGIVVFVKEPLDAAVARFAHYHGRSIRVTEAAAALQVSGRYSLNDLEGFLSGLEEPLGIRTTPEAGGGLRVGLHSK